jgi:transcriptional regulator with XRE-family HTH domain
MSEKKEILPIVADLTTRRGELGWSQAQLAEKMGLGGAAPQSQVSDWERGRKVPELSTIIAWVAALDLELRLVPKAYGGSAP